MEWENILHIMLYYKGIPSWATFKAGINKDCGGRER